MDILSIRDLSKCNIIIDPRTGKTITLTRVIFPIALFNYLFKTKDPCLTCIVQATCTQTGDSLCKDKERIIRFKSAFKHRVLNIKRIMKRITLNILSGILWLIVWSSVIVEVSIVAIVLYIGGRALLF